MKITLSHIVSILICLVLVAAAVCIGAVRGWSSERDGLQSDMNALLEIRAMDAANLCVVAARHVPGDADLVRLQAASALLLGNSGSFEERTAADEVITEAALALTNRLASMPTVQSNKRDSGYVAMFTDVLNVRSSLARKLGPEVSDFNNRLSGDLTGKLAMLLGVSTLPALDAQ